MSAALRNSQQTYTLPSLTGIATAIYENEAGAADAEALAAHRAHIAHETAGVEKLQGTYPFTLERSVKAYRLNKFLHALVEPAHRSKFLANQEAAFVEAELSEEERAMIRSRDWRALIRYGASFFMLEKLGAVVGVSNLHIYAAMRGQTLEEFQKTRNAPGALYSVAGKEAGALAWDETSRQKPS
jgi:gallate dioxygenase